MRNNFSHFKFGYIPNSSVDLVSEIKFAKEYFDFVEITLKYNLGGYSEKYLKKIKKNN